jgi:hypothetical protein
MEFKSNHVYYHTEKDRLFVIQKMFGWYFIDYEHGVKYISDRKHEDIIICLGEL